MFPFLKTLKSIQQAKLLRYMVFSALLALVLAAGLITVCVSSVNFLLDFESTWLATLAGWGAGIGGGIIAWFLLPTLVVLVSGLFSEIVIAKVEKVFYPQEQRSIPPRFFPDFLHDVRFTLWALGLNICIVPFYFLGVGFIFSILLNSYLLGREFFEIAAGYHLGKKQAYIFAKKFRLLIYLGGLMIALGSLVPIVNMAMPVLGVVWMVHLYHQTKNGG